MRNLLILFLLLFSPVAAYSCSFSTSAEFCPLAQSLEARAGVNHAVVHLVGEEVIYDQRPDGSYYAPIFRVRILNSLKGRFNAGDVIHLWTGDDWDCNGPVDFIAPDQEYLIGFPDSLTDQTIVSELMPNAPGNLYNLWGWSSLTYAVRPSPIGLTVNTLEYGEQNLTEFFQSIDGCHPEKPSISLSLYPNPTADQLTITSTEVNINNVAIYDQAARFIGQQQNSVTTPGVVTLSISHLPAGIYNVVIKTDIGQFYRRVVKR